MRTHTLLQNVSDSAFDIGRLGGQCNSNIPCTDPRTECREGLCQCQSGYEQNQDKCTGRSYSVCFATLQFV